MATFLPTPSPRYFAPASIQSLDGGGVLKSFEFDCEFKRFKNSELEKLDEDVRAWRKKGGLMVDSLVLARVCTAWRVKVPKADGSAGEEIKVIPFSEEAAAEMNEQSPGFISSCVRAFYISTQPAQAAHLAEKN